MPPADPVALLIDHLRCLEARGERTVLLTRPARQALVRIRSGEARAAAPQAAAPAPAPDAERPPAPVGQPGAAPAAPVVAVKEPDPAEVRAQAQAPAPPAGRLAEIRARAEGCAAAKAMTTLRDTFVFAVGNPEAELMFVGEAPGYDEERLAEPFVGKAGQLLDKIIAAMGLERGDTYISNVLKWRPSMEGGGDQGTANRKPTPEEMAVGRPFLLEEIGVVRPRVVVALGATAAQGLLGRDDPVGRLRSRFHDLGGTPCMVTYHPSYLLRSGASTEKRKVWEDMLMVMEKLGMPVSGKQRGYFLQKGK